MSKIPFTYLSTGRGLGGSRHPRLPATHPTHPPPGKNGEKDNRYISFKEKTEAEPSWMLFAAQFFKTTQLIVAEIKNGDVIVRQLKSLDLMMG